MYFHAILWNLTLTFSLIQTIFSTPQNSTFITTPPSFPIISSFHPSQMEKVVSALIQGQSCTWTIYPFSFSTSGVLTSCLLSLLHCSCPRGFFPTTLTPIHLLHIHLEPLHYFILLFLAKVHAFFPMINLQAQQSHGCPLLCEVSQQHLVSADSCFLLETILPLYSMKPHTPGFPYSFFYVPFLSVCLDVSPVKCWCLSKPCSRLPFPHLTRISWKLIPFVSITTCYRLTVPSQKSHKEVLAFTTSECDFLWRSSL